MDLDKMPSTALLFLIVCMAIMAYRFTHGGQRFMSWLVNLAPMGPPSLADIVSMLMLSGQIGGSTARNNYAVLLLAIVPFWVAAKHAIDVGWHVSNVLIGFGSCGVLLVVSAAYEPNDRYWLLLVPLLLWLHSAPFIMSPLETQSSNAQLVESIKALVYTMIWATSPTIAGAGSSPSSPS
jgi:hypothetical protein